MGRPMERADPLQEVEDFLRGKKGVPYASGKLEMDGESKWVEYVRGKDLLAHLKERPHQMAPFVAALKPGRTVDEQAVDFCELLLRRRLLLKAERKFKKPKPGKKKLVKWPRSLEASQEAGFSAEAFFAWAHDRPTSPWTYVLSGLLVAFTVGCCLFPLAPHHVRIWVVYSLLGLLTLLLGTMLLRYVLLAAAWIVTGGELWLFPNMTSERVPITEAFSPVLTYKRAERQTVAHWAARLTALVVVAGLVYVLHAFSPGAVEMRENARKAHDGILTLLERLSKQQLHLGNGTAEAGAGGNGTAAGGGATGGAAHGPEL